MGKDICEQLRDIIGVNVSILEIRTSPREYAEIIIESDKPVTIEHFELLSKEMHIGCVEVTNTHKFLYMPKPKPPIKTLRNRIVKRAEKVEIPATHDPRTMPGVNCRCSI